MEVRKYQNDDERLILIGLIVNDRFLGKVHSKIPPKQGPFRSRWSNLIYSWCSAYFSKYQRAPRKSIQSLFNRFAQKVKDKDTIELVERFLGGLDEDFSSQDINEDFLLDQAARYFNQIKLEKLKDEIEGSLDNQDPETAVSLLHSYNPLSLSTSAMIDVLNDIERMKEAITPRENDVMVQYGGDLGEFFGPHLCRDGFISFLAPEKRGKSFFLLDLAWRAAILNKRRTLFYSVGDMSERQMERRLMVRMMRRPIEPGKIYVPKKVMMPKEGGIKTRRRIRKFSARASLKIIREAREETLFKAAHKTPLLLMRCTPTSTTKVVDIEADIDERIRDGWIPDVVVIDYADILAPEQTLGEGDHRHQIDQTWMALRRLSQKYHALVVTATQSNAASYEKDLLRRSHFSEDKRKFAHVTGMVGLNQNNEEKNIGVYRLNWILLREGFYHESKCVAVAGCLAIANPAMVSSF